MTKHEDNLPTNLKNMRRHINLANILFIRYIVETQTMGLSGEAESSPGRLHQAANPGTRITANGSSRNQPSSISR